MQAESVALPPQVMGVHYCPNTPYPVEKKLGKRIFLIDTKTGLPATINEHGCAILEANRDYAPEPSNSYIIQWWNTLSPLEQAKLKLASAPAAAAAGLSPRRRSISPNGRQSFVQTKAPIVSPIFAPAPTPATATATAATLLTRPTYVATGPGNTSGKRPSLSLFTRVLHRTSTIASLQDLPAVHTTTPLVGASAALLATKPDTSARLMRSSVGSASSISLLPTEPTAPTPAPTAGARDIYTEFEEDLSIETASLSQRPALPTPSPLSFSASMELRGHFTLLLDPSSSVEICWTKLTSRCLSIYTDEKMTEPPKYSFQFPNDAIAIYDEKSSPPQYGFYFVFKYRSLHFVTKSQSLALSWASAINSVNVSAFDLETPLTPVLSSFSLDFRREYQELLQSFDFVELTHLQALRKDASTSSLTRLMANLDCSKGQFTTPKTSMLLSSLTTAFGSTLPTTATRSKSSPDLLSPALSAAREQDKSSPTSILSRLSYVSQSGDTVLPDLKAVSLDALLYLLLLEFERNSFYVHAFLLGHRHFSNTHEVLCWLLVRFQKQLEPDACADDVALYVERQPLLRLRVLRILKFWIDTYPLDFRAPAVHDTLHRFFQQLLRQTFDPHEPACLVDEQARYFRTLAQWMHRLLARRAPPPPAAPAPVATKATVLHFDPQPIAHALTRLEHTRFRALRPLAFVLKLWHKAPNAHVLAEMHVLDEMTAEFNKISYWVATEICTQPELPQRIKAFERFISIAKLCRRENNFNTSMAILAGLNNASILRLKETWDGISSKSLTSYRHLEALFSQSHNYSNYRQVVGQLDRERKTPFIPFFGLFVKDLYFFNENPIFTLDKAIDFTKIESIVAVLVALHAWQAIPYTAPDVPLPVQEYCMNLRALSEATLYKYSCLCEAKKGDGKLKFSEKWAKDNAT